MSSSPVSRFLGVLVGEKDPEAPPPSGIVVPIVPEARTFREALARSNAFDGRTAVPVSTRFGDRLKVLSDSIRAQLPQGQRPTNDQILSALLWLGADVALERLAAEQHGGRKPPRSAA